ncbi:hypothetical protein M1O52_04265 [Dehalococcoidia bacterium]|nr:hypothetical protein [Dehalococcoidia bacterium]
MSIGSYRSRNIFRLRHLSTIIDDVRGLKVPKSFAPESSYAGRGSTDRASQIDIRKIGEKGRELFKTISEELERDYRGKLVAIEVDSGDYFIGDTAMEADEKAKGKYPDKAF